MIVFSLHVGSITCLNGCNQLKNVKIYQFSPKYSRRWNRIAAELFAIFQSDTIIFTPIHTISRLRRVLDRILKGSPDALLLLPTHFPLVISFRKLFRTSCVIVNKTSWHFWPCPFYYKECIHSNVKALVDRKLNWYWNTYIQSHITMCTNMPIVTW